MDSSELRIEDVHGPREGQRVLRLNGPLVINNFFDFQRMIREDQSKALIIDFSNVPYVDSAGIGALVGAYVSGQKTGRSLTLVSVSDRIRTALRQTKVDQFFSFAENLSAATAGK
ncbi:MAG TPA: STAS domain-containing protein [Candidatus Limnocylindrales bacterium]|jgi:anti-sigma B factor antagonist|nr:STAS domain-containing protein [Candidatus Limnocylindrales bacterium]